MIELIFWLIGLSSVWLISKVIPAARRLLQQWVYDAMEHNPAFQKKDYEDTVDTLECIKVFLRFYVFDKLKVAIVGCEAPNPVLVALDGKEMELLDLQKKARPLVINFGNCT